MKKMRKEYKYFVPNHLLDNLRRDIAPFVELDNFAFNRDRKEYTVRSIYFDTMDMEYYREKIEGLMLRKKIRIRGYNEVISNKLIFLEIKNKYESFNYKNRTPLLYSELEELFKTGKVEDYIISGKRSRKTISDGKHFFFWMIKKNLRPTVLVVYDREAFFGKFNDALRITFDKNLRFMAYPKLNNLYSQNLQPAFKDHFILEVKFDKGFAYWLQEILTRYRLTRRALSKYTICLDAHHNYFPVTKTSKYSLNYNAFERFYN